MRYPHNNKPNTNHRKWQIILFLLLVILIVITPNLYSQLGKHSINIYYTPQITKTNFTGTIKPNNLIFVNDLYQTAKPNKPLAGYSFGLEYKYTFTKSSIGFFLKKSLRGQKSEFAYNYKGLIPADTSLTNGGLFYSLEIETVSFGFILERELVRKVRFYSGVHFGVGLDVHQTGYIRNFRIDRQTGFIERGCCVATFSQLDIKGMERYVENFKKGYYRLEFSLSLNNRLMLFKNVDLEISPQIFFLTKILKDSKLLDNLIPDGNIMAGGVKLGIGYYF